MRADPNRCLLLIDDEPAQRRLVTAIGARAGWWVRGASDFDAAKKMFEDPQEPKFDAILLDHWLPGEDGTELIREIRAAPARSALARPHRPERRRRSRSTRCAPAPVRLHRQAARARPAARRAQHRHRPPQGVRRAAPALREDRQGAGLRGDRRLGAQVPHRARHRRQGRPRPRLGADRGRERIGQGDRRPGDPRRLAPRQEAAPHRQLRRDPRKSRRIGPVRP